MITLQRLPQSLLECPGVQDTLPHLQPFNSSTNFSQSVLGAQDTLPQTVSAVQFVSLPLWLQHALQLTARCFYSNTAFFGVFGVQDTLPQSIVSGLGPLLLAVTIMVDQIRIFSSYCGFHSKIDFSAVAQASIPSSIIEVRRQSWDHPRMANEPPILIRCLAGFPGMESMQHCAIVRS
ncbi:hypothetical protein CPB84DRAFT_1847833 [Gymnopilus junonius]|uniref:Uncharacterized protein n=1 Tax=Gymnopilus junonius TaxID=109634 RepID=A0A9P5TN75_GYMJU|nr:hypothetical protein CPB84DRAFT_1847833 [Gymnopilus junonius]